jgi:hypothetical protein
LNALLKQFSAKSLRVKKLGGMVHEARGEADVALQLYNQILAEDDTNSVSDDIKHLLPLTPSRILLTVMAADSIRVS